MPRRFDASPPARRYDDADAAAALYFRHVFAAAAIRFLSPMIYRCRRRDFIAASPCLCRQPFSAFLLLLILIFIR